MKIGDVPLQEMHHSSHDHRPQSGHLRDEEHVLHPRRDPNVVTVEKSEENDGGRGDETNSAVRDASGRKERLRHVLGKGQSHDGVRRGDKNHICCVENNHENGGG